MNRPPYTWPHYVAFHPYKYHPKLVGYISLLQTHQNVLHKLISAIIIYRVDSFPLYPEILQLHTILYYGIHWSKLCKCLSDAKEADSEDGEA